MLGKVKNGTLNCRQRELLLTREIRTKENVRVCWHGCMAFVRHQANVLMSIMGGFFLYESATLYTIRHIYLTYEVHDRVPNRRLGPPVHVCLAGRRSCVVSAAKSSPTGATCPLLCAKTGTWDRPLLRHLPYRHHPLTCGSAITAEGRVGWGSGGRKWSQGEGLDMGEWDDWPRRGRRPALPFEPLTY